MRLRPGRASAPDGGPAPKWPTAQSRPSGQPGRDPADPLGPGVRPDPFPAQSGSATRRMSAAGYRMLLRCRIWMVRGARGACGVDGAHGERSAWWMADRYAPAHTQLTSIRWNAVPAGSRITRLAGHRGQCRGDRSKAPTAPSFGDQRAISGRRGPMSAIMARCVVVVGRCTVVVARCVAVVGRCTAVARCVVVVGRCTAVARCVVVGAWSSWRGAGPLWRGAGPLWRGARDALAVTGRRGPAAGRPRRPPASWS
jgi:hypothetical protein